MPGRPEVRANWCKHSLRFIRRQPPPRREAVLAEAGSHVLEQIGSAGIFTWLPVACQARLFDAVCSVLRQPGAIAFWRDAMTANMEQPLLRPLVEGGLRLFGATPYSVIRMSPRAWSLVTRNCGTHLVSRGAGRVEVRIEFVELPPELATLGFVAHAIGNCEAVLELLRLRGTTELVEERLSARRFTVAVSDVVAKDGHQEHAASPD